MGAGLAATEGAACAATSCGAAGCECVGAPCGAAGCDGGGAACGATGCDGAGCGITGAGDTGRGAAAATAAVGAGGPSAGGAGRSVPPGCEPFASRGSVTPQVTQNRYIGGFDVPHVGHAVMGPGDDPRAAGALWGSAGSRVLLAGTGATGTGGGGGTGGTLSGRERPGRDAPAGAGAVGTAAAACADGAAGPGAALAPGVGAGAVSCRITFGIPRGGVGATTRASRLFSRRPHS